MAAPANRLLDFGFAFNDVNFSDRILRIEISSHDLADQREEHILDSSMPDLKDGINNGNQEEAVAMIEESSVGTEVTVNEPTETNTCFLEGQEVAKDNEPSYNMERSGIQVRTLHVSAPILAVDSPFFYKLFSNGMKESQQQHVTLHIQASEEDALMDLLNFMYRNTLPRSTPTALLNVLVAADKFEVASCMKYCSQLLRTLPMTCESALLYLGLPTTVLMPETVQQLRDAARKFLVDHFKDLAKREEFLKLPLAGFEAVLSSDDLHVNCEDTIYEFAQSHTTCIPPFLLNNNPTSKEREMEGSVNSHDALNLKATELRLGLPGRDESEQPPKSNKRSSSSNDEAQESAAPPPKAQVVGWPPVRSHRRNAIKKPESDGSGMLVKVSMDGAPYLRKIDIKFYNNYFDLLKELENMFKCTIGREGYNGPEFTPTYEDKDGDWMLVGDVPWEMFITSCKRLRIMKGSEANGLVGFP